MANFVSVMLPAASPIALGGPPEVDRPGIVFSIEANVRVYQRVFSSGLSSWCYYSSAGVDVAPLPSSTIPNWTGSITAHEVIARR
jgi:hypothetical protein